MKELEERILKDGKVLPGNILKVGAFLNQTVDTGLMMRMGQEVARLYQGYDIDKIFTVEASGIPFAFAVGVALNKPIVIAKKHKSANIGNEVYSTVVHSYTHGEDYTVVVGKEHFSKGDKVLLTDDFLAVGNALHGLTDLVNQAGGTVVGCAVAVEKGFQQGGDKLRATGMRVESLALVESMDDYGHLTFRR